MRILIIGAGAVGGYFGARLAQAGRDITFLVRDHRAEQLRRTGLQIQTPTEKFSFIPRLLTAPELAAKPEAFDLILLSTKAYQLDAAIEDFAPAVGAQTAILPLLNGMKHLETLTARFGEEHVLGGSTRISADLDDEGRVLQLEDLQDLVFGERDKRITPRIEAIARQLSGAGFDDKLSPDILAFMWQKWVILASLASITCLFRGSIGEVAAVKSGPETARAIIDEVASIARDSGYPAPQPFLKMVYERLTKPGSKLTASMYRDMQRGAPVEVGQILGDLLDRGLTYGLDTPLLQAAYVRLSVYMAGRSRK
jgi:2-dehydropantoate 2-reductase